jgi:hypothetical protein
MPRISQDAAMGGAVILVCLMLLSRDRWFLERTGKGQRLVQWFGDAKALWAFRALLLAGMIIGGLLAMGIIRPIQW